MPKARFLGERFPTTFSIYDLSFFLTALLITIKGVFYTEIAFFMNDLTLTLHPIAVIHTPYKEKFSVPRQPDLVQDGIGIVELLPPV